MADAVLVSEVQDVLSALAYDRPLPDVPQRDVEAATTLEAVGVRRAEDGARAVGHRVLVKRMKEDVLGQVLLGEGLHGARLELARLVGTDRTSPWCDQRRCQSPGSGHPCHSASWEMVRRSSRR